MIQRKEIRNKCKKVKIVLTDVDGVLNDGGRYYSEKGEVLRKFHVRDGMGLNPVSYTHLTLPTKA